MKIEKSNNYWKIYYIDSSDNEQIIYHPFSMGDKEITLEILENIFVDDATAEELANGSMRLLSKQTIGQLEPVIQITYKKRPTDGWFIVHKDTISEYLKNNIVRQQDHRDIIEWYENEMRSCEGIKYEETTITFDGDEAIVKIPFVNIKNVTTAFTLLFSEYDRKSEYVVNFQKYESDMLKKLEYEYTKTYTISP